jgi:hypothetical protein
MRGGNRQTRQHKQGTFYTSSSSVGMLKPAQKLLPLDLASMPTDARDNQKFPLNNPTMSSRMKRFKFFWLQHDGILIFISYMESFVHVP